MSEFDPELQKEYEASLRRIDELYNNETFMESIFGKYNFSPNNPNPPDDITNEEWGKRMNDLLASWGQLPDKTWSV